VFLGSYLIGAIVMSFILGKEMMKGDEPMSEVAGLVVISLLWPLLAAAVLGLGIKKR